jgi:hypothetical protein
VTRNKAAAAVRLPFLVVVCLTLGGRAGAETSAPIPLFTPPMRAPEEVAGTGLAPEVGLRVTVDRQGKVSRAEVISIDPTTEYDELFERLVIETLERWRYFPGHEGDEPVEVHLDWKVKFPAVIASEESDPTANQGWRRLTPEDDSGDGFRKQILAMPLERRVKALGRISAIARAFMSGAVHRVNTPRFVVFTDAPDADVAEKLAKNLEATFNVLGNLIGEGVPSQPEPYRIVVFMYASSGDFESLKKGVRTFEWAAGFYNPLGMLAFHVEMPSNEALLSIMLHEAVHAYMDRYLSRPGSGFPRWLDEGFADYVGNSTIRKGELIPGKTRNSTIFRTASSMYMGISNDRLTLEQIKGALRRGEALSVEQLITSDRTTFYGDKRELYYPMSWILIHFLRHGREGWDDDRFGRLLLYVAEGYSAVEAFRQLYGDPAELEEAFDAYIRKF